MGRFARSIERSKAQAESQRPRFKVRSWNLEGPRRHSSPRKRRRGGRRLFSLVSVILLLIIGAGSGWMTGRILIGSSETSALQPAATVEPTPEGPATKNQAAAATSAEGVDASATQDAGGENEKTDAEHSAAQPPAYSAPSQQDRGARATRRYTKGRGFQPTTIVTKPARMLTRPFKKLNPLKIF